MKRAIAFLLSLLTTLSLVDGAAGQSLQLVPVTGSAGEWVTVPIALERSPGREPTALQWEIEIANQLEPESQRVARALLAVIEAGKSLTCAVAGNSAESRLLRCVLAGGQKPIPTGTIVLLSLRITDRAQAGTARIRLDHALAVTEDLKQLPINPVETVVTIRAH